jgi:4-hydroxybenzoate polyprenyltransferase
MRLAWLDALVWSSGWLGLAAACLTAAAARALGSTATPAMLALAFGGTLAVYVIDRVRDLPRDRATAPERAAFVARHRRVLLMLAGLGAGLAAGAAFALGPATLALAAGVGALGLAHRRLKRMGAAKPVYLTFAWTAVPVGLPALQGPSDQPLGWVAAITATAVLANVALSNLRDREALAARLGTPRTLALAGVITVAGCALALLGPASVRPLVALPAVMGAAVLGFRPTERYGGLVVDGALLIGALLALGWPAAWGG